MTAHSTCKRCEASFEARFGCAGLCEDCLARDFPPVALRGHKSSPLQLGFLALVCNLLMIPSFFAVTRAFGELREVGRRERLGIYRPEHASVRTGAVFALLLGLAQPGLLVATVLVSAVEPPRTPTLVVERVDEFGEILELLRSEDRERRELGQEQFAEVAWELDAEQRRRLLSEAQAGFGHEEEIAIEVRSSVVSALVSVLVSGEPGSVAELVPVYDGLDAEVRARLLLAAAGDPELVLDLIEHEPIRGAEPSLSVDLRRRRLSAERLLPELLARPPGPLHESALAIAERMCRGGLSPQVLASSGDGLLAEWRAARAEATDDMARSRFAMLTRVLGCVEGAEVGRALASAATDADPSLAEAAVESLVRRGDRVSDSTIRRLALDPRSRYPLHAFLEERASASRMPASTRTPVALAQSFARLRCPSVDRGGRLDLVMSGERIVDGEQAVLHVFHLRAIADSAPSHTLAVGLFDGSSGETCREALGAVPPETLIDETVRRHLRGPDR